MRVGRDFFHLQVNFARTVAAIQGVEVSELLMEWTILRQLMQLYVNPATPNPVWTAYIAGVERGEDPVDTAYTLYVDRLTRGVRDTEEPSYWAASTTRIRGEANPRLACTSRTATRRHLAP